MAVLFKISTLLFIAILLAMTALLVPAHIRSVDPSVVELAGANASSVKDKIWEEVNAAYVGPAQRYARATQSRHPAQQAHIQQLLEANPNFAISGGPDHHFEALLKQSPSRRRSSAVIPQLLPRSERTLLHERLTTSHNRTVAALLEIRDLSGLLRLHPANHAAGAPYDAGVLTLALLVEGGHFQPALSQQIGSLAMLAAGNHPEAIIACEDLMIGTLSLGRSLDYCSLSSLAELAATLSDWSQMAALFRAQPDRIDELYTALRFSAAPSVLYAYLAEHAATGDRDLNVALRHGPGAVSYLIHSERAIYRANSTAATILNALEPYRPASFIALTLRQNSLGQGLKFSLLFFAGIACALALGSAWRRSLGTTTAVSRSNPAVIMRDVLISLVVLITVWTFFEPEILKSRESVADTGLRIEFAVADTLQSLQSSVKTMQELNQVTLLVLVLFFIIQLVIYSFCLIKIKEIGRQSLSSAMKLKLLDNEDNLFDFGLYVGLGGTVLSLILVAVGIVEASLMAAYASTLFGIIFTAILKVLHLRSYRRQLILEAGA